MHRSTHMDEHSGTEGVFPTLVHASCMPSGINTVWLTSAQYTYMYKRSKHKLTCTMYVMYIYMCARLNAQYHTLIHDTNHVQSVTGPLCIQLLQS